MTAKYFADTNIILYSIGQNFKKRNIARKIIESRPVISTQVVNESINVCLRKLDFKREKAYEFANSIMNYTEVLPVDKATVKKSADIAIRYQLSNWDALIIASAIISECEILYTEDLQHEMIINNSLKIINPFF
ncbi:MAG: PIN domain-containing protein [Spirochaetota bacterium]